MQYLALIYSADGTGPQPGTEEWGAFMQGYADAGKTYHAEGVMQGGNALEHTSTATSVRVRDGKVETMDGPFAETKERLGGYYLLDCKDLDQAIRMAALIPTAQFGTVELRPIMQVELPE
ncbi:MAG: YciI family protein [Paracoccaceae bacterium]|nr:YciI family protein [Paracoccaceae bacterium]